MSSSFVKYRGHGFWSWDGYLEHVLALLAQRIGQLPQEEWLDQLHNHWRAQSSGAFRGWIHLKLDDFIINNERRDVVLAAVNEIVSQADLPREAKQTAKLLGDLLGGHLTTDAASPLDYMVSGTHPYNWSLE